MKEYRLLIILGFMIFLNLLGIYL